MDGLMYKRVSAKGKLLTFRMKVSLTPLSSAMGLMIMLSSASRQYDEVNGELKGRRGWPFGSYPVASGELLRC
jgi:hypothetical protein